MRQKSVSPSRRRRFLRLAMITVFVVPTILVIIAGCTEWIANGIVYAPNQAAEIDSLEDADGKELVQSGVDRQLRVTVGSPPVSMSVWLIEPAEPAPPRGTILLLHGSNSDKRAMLGPGRWFTETGYRAVLVDLRGHGQSSGRHITFGVRESQDLSELLDQLDASGLLTGDVGVYGTSYGGAVGIQLTGRDDRVRAVVAVASFTSMREVVPNYINIYVPFGGLISQSRKTRMIDRAGQIARIDPDKASPIDAIARSHAHVLLIHGRQDRKIPPGHSRRLHQAAPSRTGLIIVNGADHDPIMADPKGAVSRASLEWFDRYVALEHE